LISQSQASYQNNKRLVIRCAVYLYSAGVGALVEAWAVFSAVWWTVGWAELGFANDKLLAIAMPVAIRRVFCVEIDI